MTGRTGRFTFERRILVSDRKYATFDVVEYVKKSLLSRASQKLETILDDGREYVVYLTFFHRTTPNYLTIELEYTVLLLNLDHVEVNEYIHPSAIVAPAPEINHQALDGKMFERVGDPTWAWIRTA
jgi:hypothetical protein